MNMKPKAIEMQEKTREASAETQGIREERFSRKGFRLKMKYEKICNLQNASQVKKTL